MAAYSMDLRTRVLADWDAGLKAEEVAAKYRVSRTWAIGWCSGDGRPDKSTRGRRRSFARARWRSRRIACARW